MNDFDQGNIDRKVADGFGREWSTFRQDDVALMSTDREIMFAAYFSIFPWNILPPGPIGMDVGCGSGRWAAGVAPRVGHLHVIDASAEALSVARANLAGQDNVSFHLASVDNMPVEAESLDFAFSLGVLHHVPDTLSAIGNVASKLKPGAPFLIYLYYALDNRPAWYRRLWRTSNALRVIISRLPHPVRLFVSQLIAAVVYWPLARLAAIIERAGRPTDMFPLQFYRHRSFYVMRTDAYDRFCTRLEQRFTRKQIEQMMIRKGFHNITFSETAPFWCCVGIKDPCAQLIDP